MNIFSIGDIDLLGEVPGGNYQSLQNDIVLFEVFNKNIKVITLNRLIQLKRASGRPKDLEAIAELEWILKRGSDTYICTRRCDGNTDNLNNLIVKMLKNEPI